MGSRLYTDVGCPGEESSRARLVGVLSPVSMYSWLSFSEEAAATAVVALDLPSLVDVPLVSLRGVALSLGGPAGFIVTEGAPSLLGVCCCCCC